MGSAKWVPPVADHTSKAHSVLKTHEECGEMDPFQPSSENPTSRTTSLSQAHAPPLVRENVELPGTLIFFLSTGIEKKL